MAGRACLKSGSGLVTLYVPECGYVPLQTSFPEAMVLTSEADNMITEIKVLFKPSAVGIGMGLGMDKKTVGAFGSFLKKIESPVVIDADGINILAKHPEIQSDIPKNSILTPHPKELERLLGVWKDDFEKLDKAMQFCQKHECILVLKGANTFVMNGEKGYINSTGNPGMATGGSGDVLTGIMTGLLAQKYPSLDAALFGVYLHGLSGDIGASNECYEALLASDIVDNLGKAFGEILRKEKPGEVSKN